MASVQKQIWNFFEEPKSLLAYTTRYIIIFLILYSSTIAFFELTAFVDLSAYATEIFWSEMIILTIFSLEFFLRFFSSPSKIEFVKDKFNWIDAMAIFPFYFGYYDSAILRILRLLRIIKLLRNTHLDDFFKMRNTIISKVTPVVLLFVIIKGVIVGLEQQGKWFLLGDLDVLFTILGFALGIVISNKIGTTYAKYIDMRKKLATLQGTLINLSANINLMCQEKKKGKLGITIVRDWLQDFLKILKGGDEGGVRKIRVMNREMYAKAAKIGNTKLIPFHRFAAMMSGLYEDSVTLVSRRTLYTPVQYDKLILQLIVMYVLMLCVFIPGVKGIISVIFATYLLYGLHLLAIEFDHANGSEKPNSLKLIELNSDRLERYLSDLNKEIQQQKLV